MLNNDLHLSDEDLLLLADGELSKRRIAPARSHLTACWACRARMTEIERTISAFTRLHQANDTPLPSADGSRALLRARLAELSVVSQPQRWRLLLRMDVCASVGVCVTLVFLVVGLGFWGTHRSRPQPNLDTMLAGLDVKPIPNRSLTPGAIRPVTMSDVCAARQDNAVHVIPISLQRKVFQEYGIANAEPKDYELDYLITPELGGAEDPRNLWPEPHTSTVWNSHVKDELESRLHQLVCDGSLDLVTAQHDIATDWIAAYKKYFHTDRPSPNYSGLTLIIQRYVTAHNPV
jgi:hypothetical protein